MELAASNVVAAGIPLDKLVAGRLLLQFSLICGTAGRITELEFMLRSLASQTAKDYELILVDQNVDERAARVIETLPDEMSIRRLTARPGLIAALNIGLLQAKGDILGFPDDDCWYSPDFLASLRALFESHPGWDGITVPTADSEGRPSIGKWHSSPGKLTHANAGFRGCSTSMFFRRIVYEKIGGFDENIGGGLLSPSADMDYLHRAVRAGFHIEYRPELMIGHPQTLATKCNDEKSRNKRYSYGYGEGLIARKYSDSFRYSAGLIGAPLLRSILKTIRGKREEAASEWLTFRGRADGFRKKRASKLRREPS